MTSTTADAPLLGPEYKDARAYAHAAIVAALQQSSIAEDVMAGAERNGHTVEMNRYLVALSGALIGNLVGSHLSCGQVVDFARKYFATIERQAH